MYCRRYGRREESEGKQREGEMKRERVIGSGIGRGRKKQEEVVGEREGEGKEDRDVWIDN